MPRSSACSGAPANGVPIQVGISYPAVSETTGLSIHLPTFKPATAQISYTIDETNMPTITGFPIDYVPYPFLWLYVQNTSGANRTFSYQIELNGTSIGTGTSSTVPNNAYGVLNCLNWGSGNTPAQGDTISVKLWASGVSVYIQAHTMCISASKIGRGSEGYAILNPLTREATNIAVPSYGTPNVNYIAYYYCNPIFKSIINTLGDPLSAVTYRSLLDGWGYATYEGVQGNAAYVAATAAALTVLCVRRVLSITYTPLYLKIP